MGEVEAIYKLKYFIILSTKKHRENGKSTGKKQGKHREFGINWSVATLVMPVMPISFHLLLEE